MRPTATHLYTFTYLNLISSILLHIIYIYYHLLIIFFCFSQSVFNFNCLCNPSRGWPDGQVWKVLLARLVCKKTWYDCDLAVFCFDWNDLAKTEEGLCFSKQTCKHWKTTSSPSFCTFMSPSSRRALLKSEVLCRCSEAVSGVRSIWRKLNHWIVWWTHLVSGLRNLFTWVYQWVGGLRIAEKGAAQLTFLNARPLSNSGGYESSDKSYPSISPNVIWVVLLSSM